MLTTRQINTLFPFMSEKNNNDIFRSRIPKCLFGLPDRSNDFLDRERLKYQSAFRDTWDYDIIEDKPVQSPKKFKWAKSVNETELCNESETNSSENLVTPEQEERLKREREPDKPSSKKRCCDHMRWAPPKKKRQLQLSEIWREKKSAQSTPSINKAS